MLEYVTLTKQKYDYKKNKKLGASFTVQCFAVPLFLQGISVVLPERLLSK